MEYKKGYVYELMEQGGPTDCRESYFKEASKEMIRARTLCAKANATLPDDPSYISYLEDKHFDQTKEFNKLKEEHEELLKKYNRLKLEHQLIKGNNQ